MPRGYSNGQPLGGWPDGVPPAGGRPSKGERVEIKARLPADVAAKVKRLAAENGEAPSDLVTRLVIQGLDLTP